MKSKGRFIAAVGLPCVGKSRIFESLGELFQGVALLEPEEEEWPACVGERENSGYFTALMWFRCARIPMYYQAKRARDSGQTVFLDSYYDKLCGSWLGADGMEWLISASDPYFPSAAAVANLDRVNLPLADTLVLFTVDQSIWEAFIMGRGRRLDRESDLVSRYKTQTHFVAAAEDLAEETGIRLVRFHQDRIDSPEKAAARLAPLLR